MLSVSTKGPRRRQSADTLSDPNRLDDEQYIVRLVGQVITVSLETMKIIKALPEVAP
jgi:predicted helicase